MGRHSADSASVRPVSPRRSATGARHGETKRSTFQARSTASSAATVSTSTLVDVRAVASRAQGAVLQSSAAVQSGVAVQSGSAVFGAASSIRRSSKARKRIALPLVGFAFTFAFVSASLVNPLSGSGAQAATVTDATATTGVSQTTLAGQSTVVTTEAGPSTARDAYTVNYTAPVVAKPKVVATVTPTTTSSSASTSASSASTSATVAAPTAAAATPGSAQAIGAAQVAAHGWGTDQYNCLVSLWNRESGWNVYASNPSGAYGIPQALPGSKMAAFGADWQTSASTQISWGLSYIVGRYGTPCGAWAHSQAFNWY